MSINKEDSSEDDIDNRILAELAVLKASRYCSRGPYRHWDSDWERMLEEAMKMQQQCRRLDT